MTRAAQKAAKGLVRDFGELEHLQVSKKGTANFVTNADLRTENLLREELQYARPKFGFILEEGGVIEGEDADHRWVIDPLDGTTNFIHAFPYVCISIGLEKRNSQGVYEPLAGVIYDPIHDEMFTAEKGQGAYLNNRRLQVSQRKEDWLLATAAPRRSRKGYEEQQHMLARVMDSDATVRCTGAAALDLAYVAAGRLDGIWYNALQRWDITAGMLLVTESGGMVAEIGGGRNMLETGSIVATNSRIHEALQEMLHTGR